MVANLDMTANRANIAFLGSRKDIWHRMGQEMAAGQSIEEWAASAGLGWNAVKVPAIAALEGKRFDHIDPAERVSNQWRLKMNKIAILYEIVPGKWTWKSEDGAAGAPYAFMKSALLAIKAAKACGYSTFIPDIPEQA